MSGCSFCNNAILDSSLSPDNYLSYISVGSVAKGFSMHIRSGDSRPTSIVVSMWSDFFNRNVDISIYNLKYCPECGRKLIEND